MGPIFRGGGGVPMRPAPYALLWRNRIGLVEPNFPPPFTVNKLGSPTHGCLLFIRLV